ncbi:MAG: VIT family protein [Syntrophaceae bacterium PtaB.Bin038]|nr:MAG: VIT family protein [Syntrophaceae bacterium PtaB.Bin038]
MQTESLPAGVLGRIRAAQENEITEYHVYHRLAGLAKKEHNARILRDIGDCERAHYDILRDLTGRDVAPDRLRVWFFYLVARFLGLTFGLKLMEKGESGAAAAYAELSGSVEGLDRVSEEEAEHEERLIAIIDDEKLTYVGSIVLGLNDALVELTGALAGFTLALGEIRLIALAGLITGIAGAFSMAASEYLSIKSEGEALHPLRAAVYTGVTYLCTVLFLILPYLVLDNPYLNLGFTLTNALLVIFLFTYYVSVAQDIPFRRRFSEMAAISLGVAALTFGISYFVRLFFHLDI